MTASIQKNINTITDITISETFFFFFIFGTLIFIFEASAFLDNCISIQLLRQIIQTF